MNICIDEHEIDKAVGNIEEQLASTLDERRLDIDQADRATILASALYRTRDLVIAAVTGRETAKALHALGMSFDRPVADQVRYGIGECQLSNTEERELIGRVLEVQDRVGASISEELDDRRQDLIDEVAEGALASA